MPAYILVELEYLLRILLAALCGAMIGYERENRMKTAGIRTHLIVSLAAAMMMIVSKYGFYDIVGTKGISLDPSRIAAGIVSAIGFLGAGVIFVRRQTASGVTTAAGIWATVGMGMAIGAGLFLVGISTAVLIVMVQTILHKNTRLVKESISGLIVIRIEEAQSMKTLLTKVFEKRRIEVLDIKVKRLESQEVEVKLTVNYPEKYGLDDVLLLLQEAPGIKSVEV